MKRVPGGIAVAVAICAAAMGSVSDAARRPVCNGPGKIIVGTPGNDVLRRSRGRDTICGLGGSDVLIGFRGPDILVGGPGNDQLAGGVGNDILVGGAGRDRADLFNAPGPVSVDLLRGWVSGAQGIDRLLSIEDARGTRLDDVLLGNKGANVLTGGPGLDTMQGGEGNDFLVGGDGDDFLSGWFGRDSMSGGAGVDMVSFTNSLSPIVVAMRAVEGSGDVEGEGRDTFAGIEIVVGSEHNDEFSGNVHDDEFMAGGGDDRLRGGNGQDILDGGEGFDEGDGGPGTDTCPNVEVAVDC